MAKITIIRYCPKLFADIILHAENSNINSEFYKVFNNNNQKSIL